MIKWLSLHALPALCRKFRCHSCFLLKKPITFSVPRSRSIVRSLNLTMEVRALWTGLLVCHRKLSIWQMLRRNFYFKDVWLRTRMMPKASWVIARVMARTLTHLLMDLLKASLIIIDRFLLFSLVCAVMKQKFTFKISQGALLVWVTNQSSFSSVEPQVLNWRVQRPMVAVNGLTWRSQSVTFMTSIAKTSTDKYLRLASL